MGEGLLHLLPPINQPLLHRRDTLFLFDTFFDFGDLCTHNTQLTHTHISPHSPYEEGSIAERQGGVCVWVDWYLIVRLNIQLNFFAGQGADSVCRVSKRSVPLGRSWV